MLSKCANPECSAPFLYFHRGKLFRVETEGPQDRRRYLGKDADTSRPLRRIEFYWLCDDCWEKMTLVYDKASGMSVHPRGPRPVPRTDAAAA